MHCGGSLSAADAMPCSTKHIAQNLTEASHLRYVPVRVRPCSLESISDCPPSTRVTCQHVASETTLMETVHSTKLSLDGTPWQFNSLACHRAAFLHRICPSSWESRSRSHNEPRSRQRPSDHPDRDEEAKHVSTYRLSRFRFPET